MLGTPFGLNLNTPNIDKFIFQKIQKKLGYWTTIDLSLARQGVIVNLVLLSTLWYFISIWDGSRGVIYRINFSLCNFCWVDLLHATWIKVRWINVCALQNVGGLNIVDATDALDVLQAKWLIKALQLGQSNLQTLLRTWFRSGIFGTAAFADFSAWTRPKICSTYASQT